MTTVVTYHDGDTTPSGEPTMSVTVEIGGPWSMEATRRASQAVNAGLIEFFGDRVQSSVAKLAVARPGGRITRSTSETVTPAGMGAAPERRPFEVPPGAEPITDDGGHLVGFRQGEMVFMDVPPAPGDDDGPNVEGLVATAAGPVSMGPRDLDETQNFNAIVEPTPLHDATQQAELIAEGAGGNPHRHGD